MTVDVERWRQIIGAAKNKPKARKALKCSPEELNAFMAEHMPGHVWPPKPENIEREKNAKEERAMWRQRQLASKQSSDEYKASLAATPTVDEVNEAAAVLPHDLAKVLLEFVPGSRARRLHTEMAALTERGLVYPLGIMTNRWSDGYAFTGLGRAVHELLKENAQ